MENSALLIKLKEEKRVSISYQARRHDAWTDIYNLYRDIVETNELTQRQDVNIPIMKETKKTLLSRVDEPPDVIFDCLQKDIAGREKEMVINELWDQDSDTCNFAGVDIIEKNSVLLYGRAFKKLNVIDGVFMVEVPNKLDVVIDPKVNPLDIETAKFIVHLHIYKYLRDILADPKYDEDGKQDLKKVLQEGSDEQGQGQLIQFSKDKTQEAKDEVLKNLGIDNFEEFGAADVLVELNEQFTQIWDEEQKKFVRYVVVVADDNAILFKKPLKEVLGVDFWPFVSWADDVDNEDFWTDGMGDVVRTPNKIMNIYFSTMLENRVYQNLGMMWYLPTPGFDPQTFEPEPFGMYPAPMIEDSSGRLLTIEQVVKQMDIPALRDNLVEIEFLIKLVERACYSEDTETLTEDGWKYYWEIENEKIATFNPKTEKIEYHLPIKKYVYDYTGEMYHYKKDRSIDLLVSPEHKIWYRKVGHREPSEWMLKPANEIKENNIEFLRTADWEGKEKKIMILPEVEYLKQKKKNKGKIEIEMDTWLEFLGYVLSEGGMDVKGGLKGRYNLNIAQKDKKNAQKIRECLTKLPFKFTEHQDKDDYTRFDIANKTLWTWLYKNVGAYCYEKRIPKEFKSLSKRQLKILFDAYMLGDGSIDKRNNRQNGSALSVSKKLIDDLQEMGLKLGYTTKIIERQDKRGGNRKIYWRISFVFQEADKISRATPELRLKKDLVKEQYSGKIYCFEVPNHLFVTRRNGLVSIQGNTAATAIEKGIGEKKQITLGEVEELVAKSAERITSMAKFYRRAWKEFAWKWRKLKEENALAKSPITLYKKTYRGNYFEKKVYKKDWYSKEGYKERVLSSSEQAAEKKGELEKLMALGQQYPNDPVIQKIVKKRMLDTFDLTPDEMKEIKDAEKAAEVVPIPEVSVDQSQGEEERKLTEGIRRGVGELSTLT